MGQKVNPHGLTSRRYQRLGFQMVHVRTRSSATRSFRTTKSESILRRSLYLAGVPKIEIERDSLTRKSIHSLRKARYGHRSAAAPRSTSSALRSRQIVR